jgi:TatD DNase family protein
MQLIDSHVHLNFDVFEPDLSAVRSRWQEAGVIHLVHSCVEPAEFASISALAHQFPELSFAVGLHPLDAEKWTAETEQQILALSRSDSKVVAIGEMGLDFYKADNQEQQRMVFEAQLAIASQLSLPVIIHCREAAAQMREVLQDWKEREGEKARGVMHCWGGNPEETQWFLDLGFYISFSGTVTFKKALQIHESAQIVNSNRLLIETDCPFLAPVPKRGQRRNEPAYVRYVAEAVAQLRGVTLERIAAQTTENACELFGLSV